MFARWFFRMLALEARRIEVEGSWKVAKQFVVLHLAAELGWGVAAGLLVWVVVLRCMLGAV